MSGRDVAVVAAVRTPFDRFGGALRAVPSVDLGAMVIREVVGRAGIDPDAVDDVFYGTCMPAETAFELNIPARQAILRAGLPDTTRSMTIDRACCSSLTAVGLAADAIAAGRAEVCIAAGADNMSRNAVLMDPRVRWGTKIGPLRTSDPLFEGSYAGFSPVSVDAGEVAIEEGVTREMQDRWALRSQQRYAEAAAAGRFEIGEELMPVAVPSRRGDTVLETDQQPRPDTTLEALAALPTVYGSPTVTAGNAPGLNTGAAALLLTSRARAEELELELLATIRSTAAVAGPPRDIARIPAVAIEKALAAAGVDLDDVDLFEINEAFAAVPLVSSKLLAGGDETKTAAIRDRLNVNGGAVAIGHPVGATGARLVVTLIYELRRRGGGIGAAGICGGLAQGEAAVVEV